MGVWCAPQPEDNPSPLHPTNVPGFFFTASQQAGLEGDTAHPSFETEKLLIKQVKWN